MDHIFVDAKTHKGKVVEIALIRTNKRGSILASRSEVFGEHIPAIRVIESVENAIANAIVSGDTRTVVVGHQLDWRDALDREWKKAERPRLLANRVWVDLADVAWPLVYARIIANRGLDHIAEHFRVDTSQLGACPDNVIVIMQTYWEMMRRYRTVLHADTALAESTAGKSIDAFRRLVGI